MTIRLSKSLFVHIPRTGGVWFRGVVQQLGIPHHILSGDYDSHLRWRDMPNDDWCKLQPFSFIRHPLAWIKSRWSHAVEHQTCERQVFFGVHRTFDLLVRPTLVETIETVLAEAPGIVGLTYWEMAGGVEVVRVRTEDLPGEAFRRLVQWEGLGWDKEAAVEAMPMFNSTATLDKYLDEIAALPAALASAFVASEALAMSMWRDAGLGRAS